MIKLKNVLISRKGTSFPLIVAIVLVLLMIFVGMTEYFRLMIIAGGVRDAVQEAIITTVTGNYADVYHSAREGYAAGYQPNGSGFNNSVKYGNIYAYLDNTLGLQSSSGEHIKTAGGNVDFKVYGLTVTIQNAPLAPSDPANAQRFIADAEITLEVPVRFANRILPPMKIRVKVKATYTEIF